MEFFRKVITTASKKKSKRQLPDMNVGQTLKAIIPSLREKILYIQITNVDSLLKCEMINFYKAAHSVRSNVILRIIELLQMVTKCETFQT